MLDTSVGRKCNKDTSARGNTKENPGMANNNTDQSPEAPLVAILLCTYNGERFLQEQLDSIESQQHKNIAIWASDDGSNDDTLNILNEYSNRWGLNRFSTYTGPQDGFAANFLSLACNPEIKANYFAFADQDDVWEVDKLTRAIKHLEKLPENEPAIYSSRTTLIDEQGKKKGQSPLFKKKPSFKNALVQSIAAGNTMVMNKAARNLIYQAGEVQIVSHDWWAYMLVTGAGGTFIYDSYPSVLYRQHNHNVIGGVIAFSSRLKRILSNQFKERNTINVAALDEAHSLFTQANQHLLNQYKLSRTGKLKQRLTCIKKSGVYRQTLTGQLGLFAATLLNKL